MTGKFQGGLDPYIAHQIQSRDKTAVIKIEFLNFRSRYSSGLVIVVEGDDDKVIYSYWIARIRPLLPYEFFVCGGKRGVRQLRNALHIDKSGADKDTIFLVDRDFDDLYGFQSEERVFMLDRYAVENFLVERSVVEETIKVAIPSHGNPSLRETLCNRFENCYTDFLFASKELNRRIFIARRSGIDIDKEIPPYPSCVAEVRLDSVIAIGAKIDELIPFEHHVSNAEFNALAEEFEEFDPPTRYRGKYALKFLRTWLTLLTEEYRNPKLGYFPPPHEGASKIKQEELSLGSLAARSPIPAGLDQFLEVAEQGL